MIDAAEPDPDVEAMRALRGRVASGAAGVFHFPIRHHSPARALHLARALAEVRPATLVLEMQAHFADLVPLILDAATRPPVAIVSILEADGRDAGGDRLLAAVGLLADLPSAARLAAEDDDDAPPPTAPMALTDEQSFA